MKHSSCYWIFPFISLNYLYMVPVASSQKKKACKKHPCFTECASCFFFCLLFVFYMVPGSGTSVKKASVHRNQVKSGWNLYGSTAYQLWSNYSTHTSRKNGYQMMMKILIEKLGNLRKYGLNNKYL